MVTSGRFRKSTRPFFASSGTSSLKWRICFSTASPQTCGISWLRKAISISIPGARLSPKISVIFPIGRLKLALRSNSSTTTTCPIRAPWRCSSGIKISCVIRLSSGTTNPMPLSRKKRPTSCFLRASNTRTIRTSLRPRRSIPFG